MGSKGLYSFRKTLTLNQRCFSEADAHFLQATCEHSVFLGWEAFSNLGLPATQRTTNGNVTQQETPPSITPPFIRVIRWGEILYVVLIKSQSRSKQTKGLQCWTHDTCCACQSVILGGTVHLATIKRVILVACSSVLGCRCVVWSLEDYVVYYTWRYTVIIKLTFAVAEFLSCICWRLGYFKWLLSLHSLNVHILYDCCIFRC